MSSSSPEVTARAKELKELDSLRRIWEEWRDKQEQLANSIKLSETDPDEDMRALAAEESESILEDLDALRRSLRSRLLPSDPLDSGGAIMEFKPGVGGSESALFLSEVVRMYTRFCESRPEGWKIELLSSTPIEVSTSQSGAGDALKDAILEIKGDGAFGALRFEAGVHRVQRIPTTQNLGKLQSSTIAVVVLPASSDGEKKDDLVDPKDVKTEVMRSRGAGGQHVNKTESAIRLTHEPTGISVSMQDSRSQHQNRTKAWAILRARLLDRRMREEVDSNRAVRQAQVSGMDRSDRIRTYNFPQDRVTDHRIGVSLNGIAKFMEGDDEDGTGLAHLISALRERNDQQRLEAMLTAVQAESQPAEAGNGKKRGAK